MLGAFGSGGLADDCCGRAARFFPAQTARSSAGFCGDRAATPLHAGPCDLVALLPHRLHAQDPRTRTRYPVQWVRLLFTVTETFTVEGRGIVLLPEVRLAAEDEFRAGDTLMLKRPDGVEVTVRIAGRELLKTLGGKCHFVVMLPKGEEGVPIGTEVWSADRS